MPKTRKKHRSKKQKRHTRKRSGRVVIKRIPKSLFKKLDGLSPFELNYKLINMAGPNALNAGRGNPNFYNSFGRQVFADLQQTAIQLSTSEATDIDIYPLENSMNFVSALTKKAKKWPSKRGKFFMQYMKYLIKCAREDKKDPHAIIYDVVKSSLGCYYPVPPQIQPHLALVAERFLYDLVMSAADGSEKGAKMKPNDFGCFATEGAAAGILYVFNTLKENYLLLPKDKIALITPIFSPYLEMPRLSDYDLEIVELKCDPNANYALPDSEIDKLKDKSIKALFMVNPANPAAFSLSKDNIDRIGRIVDSERQDLIVLSDNVYAPFADQYNSFMISCPLNTIEVYSLSKYFGTTGWRLGLTMLAKNNRIDKLLNNLPQKYKNALQKRYETATIDPSALTFMDRIVFDSRQVAEAHVGGLSTPQQVLMGILLYYDIHDRANGEPYRKKIKSILRNRITGFYNELKTPIHIIPTQTDYYSLVDIPGVTKNIYGEKAAAYLVKEYEYLEFLFHLVSKYHTILLPGSGFGATPWRLRISLANLKDDQYPIIGKNIMKAIGDLVAPALK
jgi:aspartate 4-decarboxylase